MTDEQSRNAAPTFDTGVPHPARVYNAILGGKDNYAADRAAAEATIRAFPGNVMAARANRARPLGLAVLTPEAWASTQGA